MTATWTKRARRVTADHVTMASVTAPVTQPLCFITVLVRTAIQAWTVIKILTNAQMIWYADITERVRIPMAVFGVRWAINLITLYGFWAASSCIFLCFISLFVHVLISLFVNVISLFVHVISLFVHVILFAHVIILLFVHVISPSNNVISLFIYVILSIHEAICLAIGFVHQLEHLPNSIFMNF